MLPFRFSQPLARGVVRSRPNRFIMLVEDLASGKVERCHCPVTGNIGCLDFNKGDIPCLLSPSSGPGSKTAFTVEAISLDPEGTNHPSWLGINQMKSNRYFEHFLKQNIWTEFYHSNSSHIIREVKVGDSRIDFCIGRESASPHYIEIKSPSNTLDSTKHPNYDAGKKSRTMNSPGRLRLTRHMDSLSEIMALGGDGSDPRCSMVLVFMHDAPIFNPPLDNQNKDLTAIQRVNISNIHNSANSMNRNGVRLFQLNLNFTENEVTVSNFFKLS